MTIPLSELAGARAPFAEIWFFWASTPSLAEWCLFGNVLDSPQLWQFRYSEPEARNAISSASDG